jgi:hypothetical protein
MRRSKACSAKQVCSRRGKSASTSDSESLSPGSNPGPAASRSSCKIQRKNRLGISAGPFDDRLTATRTLRSENCWERTACRGS